MYEITPFRLWIFPKIHVCADILSIIFNITLLSVILTKTAKTFRSYAVALFCVSMQELCAAVTSEYAMVRIIPIGDSLTFQFHGPCVRFSAYSCTVAHALAMHSTSVVYSSFPFFFWFRYRVLHSPPRNPVKIALCCFIGYIPAFVTMMLWVTHASTEAQIQQVWRNANYTHVVNSSSVAAGGFVNVYDPSVLAMTLWVTLPMFPCYAVSHYYRQKFLIDIRKSAMSEATKKAQQKIVQSLTIQAILPLFPMCMAGGYNYKQFKLPYYQYFPYFEEWAMLSVTIVSAINPLLTMFYTMPYRNAIIKMGRSVAKICKRRPEKYEDGEKPTPGSSVAPATSGPTSYGDKTFY